MLPVCCLYCDPHLSRSPTDSSADASIRNSAEQQLIQAADSNFVSPPTVRRLHVLPETCSEHSH